MKALSFEGTGSEYFKIWIVNILLTIVTLGLYYPWAKVRNNRYFYGNTVLENRNFEYHATGKQLFFGYLIAMALFIIFTVIQQISPIGSGILLLVFFLAVPWIIWRSMKFSMRMTSYSNVRFGFIGKLGGSYMNYLVYPAILFIAIYLVPLSIGVLPFLIAQYTGLSGLAAFVPVLVIVSLILAFYMYAFIKKKNTMYTLNGSRFGQGEFETEVQTKKFAVILLKTLGMSLLAFAAISLLVGGIIASTMGLADFKGMADSMGDPKSMQGMNPIIGIAMAVAYLGLIIASLVILAYSISRQRTYIYDNTTLDNKIHFASTLKARPLAWVMVTNFLMVIFTLGLALPWAKVRMARLYLSNTHVSTDSGFDEYVTQKQKEELSLGDQIGDAFDIDVGIGL